MDFIWDKKKITLSSGDIYFVPRLASYTIKYHSDTVFTAVHFNFHNELAASAFRNADIQRILPDLPDENVRDAIDYIYENVNNKTNSFTVLSKFYEVAAYVSERLVKTSAKPLDERILTAMKLLEPRNGRELSIDEIAADCHMSASYFYSLFKKETGLTPVEYRNRAAVDYAAQLIIENPEKSIEEISERARFGSSAYFRRVFKAHMGVTPMLYRSRYKSKMGDI